MIVSHQDNVAAFAGGHTLYWSPLTFFQVVGALAGAAVSEAVWVHPIIAGRRLIDLVDVIPILIESGHEEN